MGGTTVDIRVDVTAPAAKGERLETAATVFVPDPAALADPPIVMFAFPGGGYNRRYFDLHLPGRTGYSQAEHHVGQGFVFVACDHVAVGDSTVPRAVFDHADVARANAATVAEVMDLLESGRLDDGIPTIRGWTRIGMGQSYGGLLLTIVQANHATFDGVAMLGWSGIGTALPVDVDLAPEPMRAGLAGPGVAHPFRPAFHFDDVPEEIVEEDMRGYPARQGVPVPVWATVNMPGGPNLKPERGPLEPGTVAAEAAAIRCPVLIANGERDVCPDPRAEPAAYASSPDITTYVLPNAAHMHNFASTRALLWARLDEWARTVAATKRRSANPSS